MDKHELIIALEELNMETDTYDIVLTDSYRTYKIAGIGDISRASRQIEIEIERTGGKEE